MLRRKMTWPVFFESLVEAAQTTAMVFMIAIGALILNNFIALAGISSGVINWIESLHLEPFMVLLVILAFFVALGTVVEGLAMIFLTVPIFVPVIESLGYDLIWFGIVLVMMTEISLITPPIGLNVFVMKTMMPEVPLNVIFRGIGPFFCADLVRLAIVVAFPPIALWLPGLVYGHFCPGFRGPDSIELRHGRARTRPSTCFDCRKAWITGSSPVMTTAGDGVRPRGFDPDRRDERERPVIGNRHRVETRLRQLSRKPFLALDAAEGGRIREGVFDHFPGQCARRNQIPGPQAAAGAQHAERLGERPPLIDAKIERGVGDDQVGAGIRDRQRLHVAGDSVGDAGQHGRGEVQAQNQNIRFQPVY